MIYGWIRNLIGIFIFIVAFYFIKKHKLISIKRWNLILLLLCFILTATSYLFPIENLLITFSSVESAYNYSHSDQIVGVLEGKNSDLIISTNNDSRSCHIIPKSQNGWKIGTSTDLREIADKWLDRIDFEIQQYKNTNDYYLIITDMSGKKLNVSDSCNSKIVCFKRNLGNNKTQTYDYCAYIKSFNEEYSVTVDGKIYTFAEIVS